MVDSDPQLFAKYGDSQTADFPRCHHLPTHPHRLALDEGRMLVARLRVKSFLRCRSRVRRGSGDGGDWRVAAAVAAGGMTLGRGGPARMFNRSRWRRGF